MSGLGHPRRVVGSSVSLLVAAGLLAAAPAQADAGADIDGYSSFTTREDARSPATAETFAQSGSDSVLQISSWDDWVTVFADSSQPGAELGAEFRPPAGQTLQAGVTYRANALPEKPTSEAGQLLVWRDGQMCGKTRDALFAGYRPANPVTGTFRITELERDASGTVTRFAATYELNCQYVGGQPGLEGSIAIHATTPAAPVPDAPLTPGPVTDLQATNVGPDRASVTSTTLTWTNPTGSADISVDMVQSTNPDKLPAAIGDPYNQLFLGVASRWYEPGIDYMDTRTYRVVPRGPTGRLGPPSVLTVMGTRLDLPEPTQKVTLGDQATISGRLIEAWDYTGGSNMMKAPGMVGRTVTLCRQAPNFSDAPCTSVARTTTGDDGHFSFSVAPDANTYYTIVVPATKQMVANVSQVFNTVLVAPQTDLTVPVSGRLSPRRVDRRGSVIHFSTSKARAGTRGIVRLQRWSGTAWRTVVTKRLDTLQGSRTRRLAVPYRESARGRHAYRVVKPGDAHHIDGYSRTVHIRVR